MSKMFQTSQLPSRYVIPMIIPILVTLITFTSGEITEINVIEGEDIGLDFSYSCNSSEVTLRYGYRAPIYDSAHRDSVFLPENQRLIVIKKNDDCFIRLEFSPALRSDEGGYILTSYTDGRTFLEDARIWLGVEYPPGTVSCEWSGEHTSRGWFSLKCTAAAGSMPGEIVCYQNGITVPYFSKPTELRGNILEETLWARHSQPVFCCAVVMGLPVDRCDCKDFTLDPHRNVTDPCLMKTQKAHQHDETSSQRYPPLPTTNPINHGNTEKPNSNDTLQLSFYLPLGALVLTVICLTVALILSRRGASKLIMRMEYMKKNSGRNWNDYHD